MKDWTGNKTSVSSTLGASNLSKKDRVENDYYATPPKALDPVYEYLNYDIPIWECCCGEGSLSKRLKELGYELRESDIVKRDYHCEVKDFLFFNDEPWVGDILTNPPYRYAKEFAEKSLELLSEGRFLLLYLRVQFLESQKRRPLFDTQPPKEMLVYSKRTPQCARGGDFSKPTGNATMYCWFIWKKGFKGDTIIKWI